MSDARRSAVSFVLFRLEVEGEDSLLVQRHAKWGDWSLVGGHIEERELPLDAALRETEEELPPLRAGIHFSISAQPFAELQWGPVESMSAGRLPTTYSAWFFIGEFLRPPLESLREVDLSALAAIPLRDLQTDHWPAMVTDVLARLVASEVDLSLLPKAWADSIPSTVVPTLHLVDRSPGPRRLRARA